MAEPIEWVPRGVLDSQAIQGPCQVWRFAPRPELVDHLAHIWGVSWDLCGQETLLTETMPHPTVHVVIEEGRSGLFGATTERFTRKLEGQGWVLGLKFHPGCFRPYSPRSVAQLTDQKLSLSEGFGRAGEQLEQDVLACQMDMQAAADLAESFLLARLPEPDDEAQLARRIVQRILEDPQLKRAQDVADAEGMGLRTLQRLFKECVGVSPKWVIQRYRLHEAVMRLDAGASVDLTALALELGYFDQAHFTRAFKTLVGRTPAAYKAAAYKAAMGGSCLPPKKDLR